MRLPIKNNCPQPDAVSLFQQAAQMHEKGDLFKALETYHTVVNMQPDLPEAYFNIALIYFVQKDWHTAISSYQKALHIKPFWPEAWYNLAQAHEAASDPQNAIAAYQQALKFNPDYIEAAYNLGCLYLDRKDFKKAVLFFERTIEKKPDHVSAHNNLAQAYRCLNNLPQAIHYFLQSCQLNPDFGDAWFNLAEIHQASGDFEKAVECYQKAIKTQTNPCAAFNNLGNLYKRLQQFDQAIQYYRQVVDLQPELPEGHFNLASVLRLTNHIDTALHHFSIAVQLRPNYAEAWNNVALTLKNMGDLTRARTCFDRAVQFDPDLAIARWNRSFVNLLEGRWQEGWRDFEWRFKIPQWASLYPHRLNDRIWDGKTVSNRTILVHDEQGLGDTLQFVRYLPLVRQCCGRLILETRKELACLLEGFPGIDAIMIRSKTPPPSSLFDYYIPLMSLPKVFQTTAANIPGKVPYLQAPSAKIDSWHNKIPRKGLTIGLVWSGRPEHTNDANRSGALELFEPLLQMKHIQFIGLQKGPAAAQAGQFAGLNGFFNIGDQLSDFCDTAGLLAALDMVITVDTAVAHLAGAMGRPVWVLIPFIPDWRWMMKGQTSPWYPSMRLFRQTEPKTWPAVIDRIKASLLTIMAENPCISPKQKPFSI